MNVFIVILLAVVAVSAIGGWLLCFRKLVDKPVKVMMFVGYFWLLAFVQLLLLAGGYYVWQRF